MPPEYIKTNFLEKTSIQAQRPSAIIQSDPIKSGQTIEQGKYTFYNPNLQQSFEEKKLLNDYKSSHNGFDNYKNYDAMNKNNYGRDYIKDRNYIDNNNFNNNHKIVNRVDNTGKSKINQINNNLNKVPQREHEMFNSNYERTNNFYSNFQNKNIINDNYKQSNQHQANKKINEQSSEEIIENSNFNPLSKIRTMNIKEVKEFVPKNFVIIKKESKD
jgi:hypothetical protein